jgi:shikimate kinase
MTPSRIVLVGFMGAGKTRVGEALATLLGWDFQDMDRAIEARNGKSVADIFREQGEGYFRAEERAVAEELCGLEALVVAAGGGAFAFPDTRAALQAGAATVWLSCAFDTILERIGDASDRPLAANRERMREMYSAREASYRLADFAFDSTRDTPDELARRILAAVRAGGPERGAPR